MFADRLLLILFSHNVSYLGAASECTGNFIITSSFGLFQKNIKTIYLLSANNVSQNKLNCNIQVKGMSQRYERISI